MFIVTPFSFHKTLLSIPLRAFVGLQPQQLALRTHTQYTHHTALYPFFGRALVLSVLYLAIDPRSGHLIYVYVKVNVFLNIIISFIAALNVDFALHQIP